MAIVNQANGTAVSATTGALTVAWPTHITNDVALLYVISSGGGTTATLTTANGFTLIDSYTAGSGTTGAKISVFWARATSSSMASPVVQAGTDFKYGVITTFRGVVLTGNPYDVYSGGSKPTASTSATIPGITTSVDNTFYVAAIADDLDSTAAFVTNFVNASITNIAAVFTGGTTSGTGGGLAVISGDKAVAGAIGTATVTVTSSINVYLVLALIPDLTPPVLGFTNNFEGGTLNAEISTANSGGTSGQAISSRSSTGTGTITFSNVVAKNTQSIRLGIPTSSTGQMVWTYASSSRVVMRFYFYYDTFVQDDFIELAVIRNSTLNIGTIGLYNKILLFYNATLNLPATDPLDPNTWYRIEVAITRGATTSNGRVEFAYYADHSTTPIYSYDSGSVVNAGASYPATFRLGSTVAPTAVTHTFYYDDLAVQELTSGYIGPSSIVVYDTTQFMPFFH